MSAIREASAQDAGTAAPRSRRQGRFVPYLLIAPVHLMLLAVLVLPTLGAFYLSFVRSSFGLEPMFVGWSNYLTIFNDPGFWRALWNTVVFVNLVVYGELLLGLGMAVLFARQFPLQRLWISLVIAPYAVSSVIAVLMWKFILEPDTGVVNFFLTTIGLDRILWTVFPLHAFLVVALLEIWLNTPFTFLILYSAVMGVSPELYEAAEIDGATGFDLFRHITLPVIMPAILVALMFRYIFAFRTFDVVWIMTQGGPLGSTELLSIYLFRQGFRYYDFGIAAATAWVMVLLTALLAFFYLRTLYRRMVRNAS
jgi:multiple sugar transport system permease protein